MDDMKRDMDLIRQILLEVEKLPASEMWTATPLLTFNQAEVVAHVQLAIDANLVDARYRLPDSATILRITNDGYDFLEASKQQSLWDRAKSKITAAGLPLTIYSLKLAMDTLIKDGLSHLR
jgi:hypothetical protein